MTRRTKRLGVWIGLAALALQIALAPVFSGRALAMALDPLSDMQICATAPGSDGQGSPNPMTHSGHCAECCLVHCVTGAPPVLAPDIVEFPLPQALAVVAEASYALPLSRGPPPRSLPATGPPTFV